MTTKKNKKMTDEEILKVISQNDHLLLSTINGSSMLINKRLEVQGEILSDLTKRITYLESELEETKDLLGEEITDNWYVEDNLHTLNNLWIIKAARWVTAIPYTYGPKAVYRRYKQYKSVGYRFKFKDLFNPTLVIGRAGGSEWVGSRVSTYDPKTNQWSNVQPNPFAVSGYAQGGFHTPSSELSPEEVFRRYYMAEVGAAFRDSVEATEKLKNAFNINIDEMIGSPPEGLADYKAPVAPILMDKYTLPDGTRVVVCKDANGDLTVYEPADWCGCGYCRDDSEGEE